jgi:hypothetical protein
VSKSGRTWFPLDVAFTADDKILAAGERAGWLYLAMLGRIYLTKHHGVITRLEVGSLGIPGWDKRLGDLVKVGLIQYLEDGVYLLPAWEDWQGDPQRAQYMRAWRAKKAREGIHLAGQESEG